MFRRHSDANFHAPWPFAILLLAFSFLAAAQTPTSPPEPTPTRRPRTAEQIVAGKCLQCHRKVVEEFVNEVHGKSAHFMAGASEATCETCHGPGEKHNETTLAKDILNPPKMAARDVDKMCLACHAREHRRIAPREVALQRADRFLRERALRDMPHRPSKGVLPAIDASLPHREPRRKDRMRHLP
jgi:hypothetical protein